MCYTETASMISFGVCIVAGIYLILNFSILRLLSRENSDESESDNRLLGLMFIIIALSRIPEWLIYRQEPEECSTFGSHLGFLILLAVQPPLFILLTQRFSKRFKLQDTSVRFSDILLLIWLMAFGILISVVAITEMNSLHGHRIFKGKEVPVWCVTEESCTKHQCFWKMDWNPIGRKLYVLWWTVTYLTLSLSLEDWFFWTVVFISLPIMVFMDKEHLIGSTYACVWGPLVVFVIAAMGLPSWLSSQFSSAFSEKRQKRFLVAIPLHS